MKKKINVPLLFLALISPLFLSAQVQYSNYTKVNNDVIEFKYNKGKVKQPAEDSLWSEFQNTIYYSFYNPQYMTNTTTISTIMKINIDWQGKVNDISFSDSADSIFVAAFKNHTKWHDDKTTLERYAKIKLLTNISLLIPINYEPRYPTQKKVFTYDELEGLMKFSKKSFTGRSIVFEAVNIPVLEKGNM